MCRVSSRSGIAVSNTKLCRYMNGVRLPDWVRNSAELKILGRESTLLCLIINDLYSAPKEIVGTLAVIYVLTQFANIF